MNKSRLAIIFYIAVFLLVAAVAALAAFLWINYQKAVVKTSHSPSPTQTIAESPQPTATPDPLAPYGILLLGYGGAGHDGGALTDTIILGVIAPKQETIYLISIPRDLWISLPLNDPQTGQPVQEKVNVAYAIGNDQRQYLERPEKFKGEGAGGLLAMETVAAITDIPIKYFIAVDFNGFQNAIDQLGGVDVSVGRGFDDPYYPIKGEENNTCGKSEEEIVALTATLSGDKLNQQFSCRYEHIYFDAGTQQMDGETALKFARSRHSTQSGNDFARAERQQAVIQAIKKKLLSITTIPKILPLISNLSKFVQTNIDANTLADIAQQANQLSQYKIKTIVISEQNVLQSSRSSKGQYILIPKDGEDWQIIHDFLREEMELE